MHTLTNILKHSARCGIGNEFNLDTISFAATALSSPLLLSKAIVKNTFNMLNCTVLAGDHDKRRSRSGILIDGAARSRFTMCPAPKQTKVVDYKQQKGLCGTPNTSFNHQTTVFEGNKLPYLCSHGYIGWCNI